MGSFSERTMERSFVAAFPHGLVFGFHANIGSVGILILKKRVFNFFSGYDSKLTSLKQSLFSSSHNGIKGPLGCLLKWPRRRNPSTRPTTIVKIRRKINLKERILTKCTNQSMQYYYKAKQNAFKKIPLHDSEHLLDLLNN